MATPEKKRDVINTIANVTKAVVGLAIPFGVGVVSKQFFGSFAPPMEAKKITKIGFKIGQFAIDSAVSYQATKHVESMVDDVSDSTKKLIHAAPDIPEELTENGESTIEENN